MRIAINSKKRTRTNLKDMPIRRQKIIAVLFTLIGVVLLGISVYVLVEQRNFISLATETEGTVTELDRRAKKSSNKSSYYPIVEFTLADGETMRFVSSVGSRPPKYDVGEKVTVLYDPTSPQNAEIDSFLTLWGGSLFAAIFSAGFLLFGLSAAWYISKRPEEEKLP